MERFAVAVLMLSCLLPFGCGGAPPAGEAAPAAAAPDAAASPDVTAQAASTEEPVQGDWLVTQLPAEMPHLNPYTSSDAYATRVMGYMFEGLLERDPDTLEMKPWIAASWEESEDHLVYTFHLRKDVTFSDGQPLTAHDVKFSFDTLKNPEVDAPHARNYFESVDSCEVVDDYTVRYTCNKPYFLHLVMLGSLEILPKHIYEKGDFNKDHLRTPVGSGPYVLEKWETGQRILLARSANYWNAAQRPAWFDKHVFTIITDDNAAFQVLMRGDLDVMALRPEDWVDRANTPKFNERLEKYSFFTPAYGYIGWNARKPQFADKRVRRALTMLLDRPTILEKIYYGLAKPISAGLLPGTPEYDDTIQPWPFDPPGAVALLEEAGWKDTDGDGVRDKDGVPFRFEVMMTDGNPSTERILTVFQEELGRAGIVLNIRVSDWASMVERVQKREFESMVMGWQMTPDPDEYQLWHSSQTEQGSNYVGFNNPEADQIIEQNRVSFDHEERIRLMHRFHAIMHEEQPYTFLFAPKALVAVDKRIQGVVFHNLVPVYPRWEWFVPRAMQRYK
jgi:peptide/nickel transport system substrate-binding protein